MVKSIVSNPLYDEWFKFSRGVDPNAFDRPLPSIESLLASSDARAKFTKQYAWAIPNQAAVRTLVQHSPLIEVGAGTGYWASLVTQMGGDIICFDQNPPGVDNNHWHEAALQFHPVQRGEAEVASQYPNRTLFLCWPPYNSAMAYLALKHYTGQTLVFVGEGEGGCTGNDEFFGLLAREWREVKEISIPQWWGIHDRLWVYQRRVDG